MIAVTAEPLCTRAVPASLPDAAAVVRAFTTIPPGRDRHAMLAAAALVAEHRLRVGVHPVISDLRADDPMGAAAARAVCARDTACAVRIDRWAATELSEGRAGVLHTESLGQLIARLVTVWLPSQRLADSSIHADDPRGRVASAQLGQLGRAYDDLVTDLRRGRRRLPALQTPTGPSGLA